MVNRLIQNFTSVSAAVSYTHLKAQGKSVEAIKDIINGLHEANPMMGHRGCRLAVTYPEIAKMQTKAVIRAAINVQKAHADWTIVPEIMIPLIGDIKELKYVKKVVVETADAVSYTHLDVYKRQDPINIYINFTPLKYFKKASEKFLPPYYIIFNRR